VRQAANNAASATLGNACASLRSPVYGNTGNLTPFIVHAPLGKGRQYDGWLDMD
jgi:hypothetical protein